MLEASKPRKGFDTIDTSGPYRKSVTRPSSPVLCSHTPISAVETYQYSG